MFTITILCLSLGHATSTPVVWCHGVTNVQEFRCSSPVVVDGLKRICRRRNREYVFDFLPF